MSYWDLLMALADKIEDEFPISMTVTRLATKRVRIVIKASDDPSLQKQREFDTPSGARNWLKEEFY